MRLLVFGGRNFTDVEFAFQVLDSLHAERPVTLVIHGAARGADKIGGAWAITRRIPVKEFPADWARYRRSAGPIRNKQMLLQGKPDAGIAFKGGAGTADMKMRLLKAGIEVIDPYEELTDENFSV